MKHFAHGDLTRPEAWPIELPPGASGHQGRPRYPHPERSRRSTRS